MATALVLVSHSAQLAAGVAEIAAQMAPDVRIEPVGGTDDGRIGTSLDRVQQAIEGELEQGADGVVLLTDLGSATLTAEAVIELLDDDRVHLVDAPFVEASVAAAVAAQGGADAAGVVAAGATAIDSFQSSAPEPAAEPAPAGEAVTRSLTLTNSMGLHARPAAVVARMAADYDATVTLNGVDAASVLALMALALTEGAQVDLSATGPQAAEAIEALAAQIESGFGEE